MDKALNPLLSSFSIHIRNLVRFCLEISPIGALANQSQKSEQRKIFIIQSFVCVYWHEKRKILKIFQQCISASIADRVVNIAYCHSQGQGLSSSATSIQNNRKFSFPLNREC